MYKLNISPEAGNDLVEIKGYISQELCSPEAALKLIKKITSKIRGLAEYPAIGGKLSAIIDIQTDYRFLVCNNYLIFYNYDEENAFVSRILYGRRDYTKILFISLPNDQEE